MDSEGIAAALAKIEAKQDALLSSFAEHRSEQKDHNDKFYEVRDNVNGMKTMVRFLGAIIAAVGGERIWSIIALFMGKH